MIYKEMVLFIGLHQSITSISMLYAVIHGIVLIDL